MKLSEIKDVETYEITINTTHDESSSLQRSPPCLDLSNDEPNELDQFASMTKSFKPCFCKSLVS